MPVQRRPPKLWTTVMGLGFGAIAAEAARSTAPPPASSSSSSHWCFGLEKEGGSMMQDGSRVNSASSVANYELCTTP